MADPSPDESHQFICTSDEAGRVAAVALRTEVVQRLAEGSEELRARQVTAENFASTVVLSLEWDYRARISGIACDQWFGA